MPFVPFDMEEWQSTWENRVRHNLSESGVHPLSIDELLALAGEDADRVLRLRMVYSQANGTEELRQRISARYAGASPGNVLVTTGSAEANFVTCWRLLGPGTRAVVVAPTYMQTWGLATNFGGQVELLPCTPERLWDPDPEHLERVITPGTTLVVVTNPNNPTGHVLSAAARQALLDRTRSVGAWLLADEVYQGAERNGVETPTLWGSYDRVIVTGGLSKAYGLPGLRIGWSVGPADLIASLWRRHDYTVIGPGPVTDFLATLALRVRPKILERTRSILNRNYPVLDAWLKSFGDFFEWQAPEAGAICWVRYRHRLGSLELAERMRAEHSVLLEPGDHFRVPHHLRIGFGGDLLGDLDAALAELTRGLQKLLAD